MTDPTIITNKEVTALDIHDGRQFTYPADTILSLCVGHGSAPHPPYWLCYDSESDVFVRIPEDDADIYSDGSPS